MFGLSQEATVGNLFSNGVSTLVSTNDIDLHEFPCSIKNGWYNNMFDMPQAATVGNPFSNDVSTLDNDIDLHEFPNEKFMRFEGPVESAGLSNYTYGFGKVAIPSHVPEQGVQGLSEYPFPMPTFPLPSPHILPDSSLHHPPPIPPTAFQPYEYMSSPSMPQFQGNPSTSTCGSELGEPAVAFQYRCTSNGELELTWKEIALGQPGIDTEHRATATTSTEKNRKVSSQRLERIYAKQQVTGTGLKQMKAPTPSTSPTAVECPIPGCNKFLRNELEMCRHACTVKCHQQFRETKEWLVIRRTLKYMFHIWTCKICHPTGGRVFRDDGIRRHVKGDRHKILVDAREEELCKMWKMADDPTGREEIRKELSNERVCEPVFCYSEEQPEPAPPSALVLALRELHKSGGRVHRLRPSKEPTDS